ncbi:MULTISPECIES: TatD family hydrolase [unclassified Flavobacterium]|uniref:TatD family hydrolase n=1 Tax=unclassified Flavobacterium TaxID=196869 RepID=UPI0012911BF5|nr:MULTISPECIES: TatD family hydrolase [unclassified Flavobacterium]MQP52569.1 TatD family deoxyribonuclease [Flavobacterium sp. LMO9]MQP62639.1 TatD family deoxyribonuclease [Flavobacterium sp. LMO6]
MTKFINLHTHKFSNLDNVIEVVNQYPWEFDTSIPNYSIGIHPWYIDESRLESDLNIIKEKLQLTSCLALGECGLDKRIEIPFETQIKVFKMQIDLVKQTNKPIVLHCVAAYDEVIAIKKELKIENPMIIHGFSKNEQVAKSLLNNGFYLSFGKYLLRNPDLEKVFTFAPENQILLETDTIEESIYEVYEKAASIKGISLEEMKAIVFANFSSVFNHNQ